MPSVNHSPSDSSINILFVRVFRNTDTQNAGNNARDGNDNASVKHQKGLTQPGMDFAKCRLAIHQACGATGESGLAATGAIFTPFLGTHPSQIKQHEAGKCSISRNRGMPQPQYTILGFQRAICSPQLSSLGVGRQSASSQCCRDGVVSCPACGLGGYKEVSWPFSFRGD